ncbi:MAG: hypothetical protein WBL55_23220, partial [Xanthobacteraceae bacterium]
QNRPASIILYDHHQTRIIKSTFRSHLIDRPLRIRTVLQFGLPGIKITTTTALRTGVMCRKKARRNAKLGGSSLGRNRSKQSRE